MMGYLYKRLFSIKYCRVHGRRNYCSGPLLLSLKNKSKLDKYSSDGLFYEKPWKNIMQFCSLYSLQTI